MKKTKSAAIILALLMTLALLAGCGGGETPSPEQTPSASPSAAAPSESPSPAEESEEPSDSPNAAVPDPNLGIRAAKNMNIEYFTDGVKLVTDASGQKLLLVPEGVTAPTGLGEDAVVSTPVKTAMFQSTTYVGFLTALQEKWLYDTVTIVCTERDQWTTQEIIDGFDSGRIVNVNTFDSTGASSYDTETIITNQPDIAFIGMDSDMELKLGEQLRDTGINYAFLLDYTEEGGLAAQFEWIKLVAAFYNLDEKAEQIYVDTLNEMERLRAEAAQIPADNRPTVVYALTWSGSVYTYGKDSEICKNIEAAGGKYVFDDIDGGSITITMEELIDKARDADILIWGSMPQYMPGPSIADMIAVDPLLAELKAVQDGEVYIYGMGYYMEVYAKLTKRFEDLVAIIHPELKPGYQFEMMQKWPK